MNSKQNIWCVPASIVCAWIYMVKERRPVRIAIFKLDEATDHAQAQVMDEDGTWLYLSERWNGECMEAYTSGQPNIPDAPEPYRYVGLMEFIQEQVEVLDLLDLATAPPLPQ